MPTLNERIDLEGMLANLDGLAKVHAVRTLIGEADVPIGYILEAIDTFKKSRNPRDIGFGTEAALKAGLIQNAVELNREVGYIHIASDIAFKHGLFDQAVDLHANIGNYFAAGRVAERAKLYGRAIGLYKKAGKLEDAGDAAIKAHENAKSQKIKDEKFKEAIELYNLASEDYESKGNLWAAARASEKSGDKEGAAKLYTKGKFYYAAAGTLKEQGKDMEARAYYSLSIEQDLENGKIHEAAITAKEDGMKALAKKLYNEVIDNHMNSGRIEVGALVAEEAEDHERASKLYLIVADNHANNGNFVLAEHFAKKAANGRLIKKYDLLSKLNQK